MGFPFVGRTLPLPRQTFRALRHRDFRLLWFGQVASLLGGWMQNVARGWLVLRLTDSPFYLGLVGFFTFLPILLFALPAGVAADRWSRRRMMFGTQGLAMLQSLLLAALTYSGRIEVWQVAAIAFGMGTVAAFDIPIRQSLLKDLVGREDLANAIALNSLAFNGARLVGPALAGLLLGWFDESLIFLINGLSYLGVLASLAAMRRPAEHSVQRRESWVEEIKQGLRHARSEPRTRVILMLVVVSSIFAFPYTVLLPVFARDVLQVGSTGLGYLTAATGLGAVVGALFIAGRADRQKAGRTIAVALSGLGIGLIGFSQSTEFAVSLALLFVVGTSMIVQMATSNTALQLLAPEAMRGRIISLYMLCFLGMSPIGSLWAGSLASRIGAPNTVTVGGAVCILTAAWFATRIPALRQAALRFQQAADSSTPNSTGGNT